MNLKFKSTKTLLNRVLSLDYFLPDNDGNIAIPYHRKDGKGKLVVVLGENAGGKSFFRRLVQSICGKTGVECMHLSMEGRTKISYNPVSVFLYGDEQTNATGANSAYLITGGIKTCRKRESKHVIFWDEPDVGLSDDWAAGSGQLICKFAQEMPEKTMAAFVVTHSKALVRELLPANPFYLYMGLDSSKAPNTIQDWLGRPVCPRNPEELKELSYNRFMAIKKILKDK